jgi:hypothetical protein
VGISERASWRYRSARKAQKAKGLVPARARQSFRGAVVGAGGGEGFIGLAPLADDS